jgi:hypothetical protein
MQAAVVAAEALLDPEVRAAAVMQAILEEVLRGRLIQALAVVVLGGEQIQAAALEALELLLLDTKLVRG